LHPGEALLATYVTKDKTRVWAVPKSGRVAFSVSNLGAARIATVVKDLRKSLDPQAATLGDILEFNVRLSNRLYGALLAPVKAGWAGAKSLLVVSHGALGQLPFSTLVTKRTSLAEEQGALFSNYKKIPWLARTHAVTVLPSVTSLASLRVLPPPNPARRPFAGFGDPYFNAKQAADAAKPRPIETAALQQRGVFNVRGLPLSLRAAPKTNKLASADLGRLPRLPNTFDEVRSIALAFNADLTKDVFTGARASEGSVKTANLSGYKVIAFATHGLVPGDLNGLHQPALALSSPKVNGNLDEDGLLTMGEILSLRLDADWVVLSACNTGAGDGAGAEAFTGLGKAFFYAGTRAVLLSNWPVETTSARLWTTDIFKRQADDPTLTRAEAMRRAMMGLGDGGGFKDPASGKIVFSYAHPIFWAPFSLVGDGGGGKPAG
jgi:CHAT domain-containing protein